MMRSIILLLAVCGLLFGGAVSHAQVNVSPLFVELQPGGAQVIRVNNGETVPVVFEVDVNRRTSDGGQAGTVAAPDDLFVFPPQAVIPPGKTQTFQIRWAGEPDIDVAQTYYVGLSRLPIEAPDGEERSSFGLTVTFAALVNVAPRGTSAELAFENVRGAPAEDGERAVEVDVVNTGSRYAYLSRLPEALVLVGSSGTRRALTSAEIKDLVGDSWVPAQGRRSLRVKLPDGFSEDVTEILLDR